MDLNDAQQKMSNDIAQLYETYQLISKNKQQFNELDVALLQQQLLLVYRSLLQVQHSLAQIPKAPVEALMPVTEVVDKSHLATVVESNTTETLQETTVVEEEEPKVEEPVLVAAPEPTNPEPIKPVTTGSLFDLDTSVSKLNNVTENEPTLDDLEKLLEIAEQPKAEREDTELQNTTTKQDLSAYSFLTVTEPKPVVTEKSEAELSLLDKLAAAVRTTEVLEKITREQQQSLKQAINLNKKIAFVNNLFNENTVEYAKAIEKLNSSSTVHEALRYFNELKHQYNWSNENVLVKELEQLIEKRFS
jgi:hypothetical protein